VQTLVAFAFDREVPQGRIETGLRRVESWYGRLWSAPPVTTTATADRLGLALWSDPQDECRWPGWWHGHHEVVASIYAPLGYEELLSESVALDDAPRALARELGADPSRIVRLTPPFVLAHLDRATPALSLHTDGLGIGRLFEVRTAEGRFWSNRPVAALLFAGRRAEADPLAWRRMAACDWPMGDATPYLGVRCLPAATRIVAASTGVEERTLNVSAHLVATRTELNSRSVEETAGALQTTAASVSRLWPRPPVLTLSGGRDSRLVVASFVAAEMEVKVKTYADVDGEVATARELVSRLNGRATGRVEHEVADPAARRRRRDRDGAYRRARQWHDVSDGLRPSVYLRNAVPRTLLQHRRVLVSGVGGEFAHAPAHPADIDRLERLPLDRRIAAFANSLATFFVLPHGLTEQARRDATEQIEAVLAHAVGNGVTDSKLFDWFYTDERLRRWGMAGESTGRVMPLLHPQFVAVASGQTTAEANANTLHRALIEKLVPEWSDVPFFHATLRQRVKAKHRRPWQEVDRELLSEVIDDPGDWADAFDVDQVQAVWSQALAGRAAGRDELLLQRVIWRASFSDHLRALNGEQLSARATWAPAVQSAPPSRSAERRTRGRRHRVSRHRWMNSVVVALQESRVARRIARTSVGRRLRRRLGV
jgi:hypothetical protein